MRICNDFYAEVGLTFPPLFSNLLQNFRGHQWERSISEDLELNLIRLI
jgi:hypothetical protein